MKKKQWLILGIFLLCISIITIVIISTLAGISTPTVTVKIDTVQLSEKNVSLNITMKLDNKNAYALALENLEVEVESSNENIIGKLSFPRKTIPAHQTKNIYAVGIFDFKGEKLDEFKSHIRGDFGIDLFGVFSFSLPVNMTVITDPMLAIDAILLPTISLDADVISVNETGVLMNGTIVIDNANDFSISLSETLIEIEHNQTILYTDVTLSDTKIKPRSKTAVTFSAFVGYGLFNTGTLTASLSSEINITVVGTSITRPFNAGASIDIPDISSFILNNKRIVVALSADFDVSLTGLNMNVGFRLFNPTKIPLTASELDIMIYRIDNNTNSLIAQDRLRNCPLPAENETCLKTTFKLPVVSFLPIVGDGMPDWFLLSIIGNFTIANSNQQIPVQLNGYLNANLFTYDSIDADITS
jgi:LEA14-like dessication related protein